MKVARQQRIEVVSGEMRIEIRMRNGKIDAPKRIVEVWFDGKQSRVDSLRESRGRLVPFQKHVFNNTEYLQFGRGTTNAAPLEIGGPDASFAGQILNPRAIGMYPTPIAILRDKDLGDVYPPATSPCERLAKRDDGRVELRYTRTGGRILSVLLDPKNGNRIERMVLQTKTIEKDVRDELDVRYPKETVASLWWPERVEFRRSRNSIVIMEEIAEISNVKLNNRIPSTVFTPEGMGVPAGTPVLDYPPRRGGMRLWDGNEIISRTNTKLSAQPATIEASKINFWTVAGVILGGLAVFAIFLAWVSKKPSSTR